MNKENKCEYFHTYTGDLNPYEAPLTCAEIIAGEEIGIVREILAKLAAYEESGLTPEEVMKLKVVRENKDLAGCTYCHDIEMQNLAGKKFFTMLPDFHKDGLLSMQVSHRKPDAYTIHAELSFDDTGKDIMCDCPIKFCPMCGRRL